MNGSVICTKAVLVVAIIDCDLDRDRRINETNDGGWHSDEVGVASVGSTSEAVC